MVVTRVRRGARRGLRSVVRESFTGRWSWVALMCVAVLALQGAYPTSWWSWVRWVIVGVAAVLGFVATRVEQRQAARRGTQEQDDRLAAAKESARDILLTTTTGLRPIASALQQMAGVEVGSGDYREARGQLQTACLAAAESMAPAPGGRACLFTYDAAKQGFVYAAHRGREEESGRIFSTIDVDPESEFGQLLYSGRTQLRRGVDDAAESTTLGRYDSFVSAPVRLRQGQVYGLLTVDHTDADQMDRFDASILTVIAHLLAAGVARDPSAAAWTRPSSS